MLFQLPGTSFLTASNIVLAVAADVGITVVVVMISLGLLGLNVKSNLGSAKRPNVLPPLDFFANYGEYLSIG